VIHTRVHVNASAMTVGVVVSMRAVVHQFPLRRGSRAWGPIYRADGLGSKSTGCLPLAAP